MKKAVVLGITLVVLWFGGNLALYIYTKHIFSSEIDITSNYTTEKITLRESPADGERIYFYRYALNFPFARRNIIQIVPQFQREEGVDQNFLISMNREYLSLWKLAPFTSQDKPFWKKIFVQDFTRYRIIRLLYDANLENYSWWNLPHNINLLNSLKFVKNMHQTVTIHKPSMAYEIETPYLKGFLQEQGMTNDQWSFSFTFEVEGETYSIAFRGLGQKRLDTFKGIISTVQPVHDIQKRYEEMEDLYRNNRTSRYPEELILISMISLKGASRENLIQLLAVMEEKKYPSDTREKVINEIEHIQESRKRRSYNSP